MAIKKWGRSSTCYRQVRYESRNQPPSPPIKLNLIHPVRQEAPSSLSPRHIRTPFSRQRRNGVLSHHSISRNCRSDSASPDCLACPRRQYQADTRQKMLSPRAGAWFSSGKQAGLTSRPASRWKWKSSLPTIFGRISSQSKYPGSCVHGLRDATLATCAYENSPCSHVTPQFVAPGSFWQGLLFALGRSHGPSPSWKPVQHERRMPLSTLISGRFSSSTHAMCTSLGHLIPTRSTSSPRCPAGWEAFSSSLCTRYKV